MRHAHSIQSFHRVCTSVLLTLLAERFVVVGRKRAVSSDKPATTLVLVSISLLAFAAPRTVK